MSVSFLHVCLCPSSVAFLSDEVGSEDEEKDEDEENIAVCFCCLCNDPFWLLRLTAFVKAMQELSGADNIDWERLQRIPQHLSLFANVCLLCALKIFFIFYSLVSSPTIADHFFSAVSFCNVVCLLYCFLRDNFVFHFVFYLGVAYRGVYPKSDFHFYLFHIPDSCSRIQTLFHCCPRM